MMSQDPLNTHLRSRSRYIYSFAYDSNFHTTWGGAFLAFLKSAMPWDLKMLILIQISDINVWMSKNFLKLNEDKTEIYLIGAKAAIERLQTLMGSFHNQVKAPSD